MREAEVERRHIEDGFKKIDEYNALVKELKQVGVDKFPLKKLERMQKLLEEIRKV